MLEAMLVQVFRADVGGFVVGRDVVYRNASFRHQLSDVKEAKSDVLRPCLLYTSPSPRDLSTSRMPSSA